MSIKVIQVKDRENVCASVDPVVLCIPQGVQGSGGLENPVNHIDFVASPSTSMQPRRMQWNADAGTLDLGMDAAGVTQQIGQELFFRVKNQTGGTIADGTLVMAAGTTGNSGRILVAPSINDGSVPGHMLIGIITHNLANGADGFATHFGQVRGINTTGAGVGETWADGDLLYPNPTQVGKLTNVLPTGAGPKNPIAIVVHAHNNGTLFVRMTPGHDLRELHDVQITSPANGNVLVYQNGIWRNQAASPEAWLNNLPEYETDDDANGDLNVGEFYWLAPASDVGQNRTLKQKT